MSATLEEESKFEIIERRGGREGGGERVKSTRRCWGNHGNYSWACSLRSGCIYLREARLGAARFRLGPLLPLACFAPPSVRETINRAHIPARYTVTPWAMQRRDYVCKTRPRVAPRRRIASDARRFVYFGSRPTFGRCSIGRYYVYSRTMRDAFSPQVRLRSWRNFRTQKRDRGSIRWAVSQIRVNQFIWLRNKKISAVAINARFRSGLLFCRYSANMTNIFYSIWNMYIVRIVCWAINLIWYNVKFWYACKIYCSMTGTFLVMTCAIFSRDKFI